MKSITEAYPDEIATELYQIGSRLRILAEMFYIMGIKHKRQSKEYLLARGLLHETSEICSNLGDGFSSLV